MVVGYYCVMHAKLGGVNGMGVFGRSCICSFGWLGSSLVRLVL